MVRIGLIGAGTVGRAHAESIARIPAATLVAVADPNEKNAKAAAQAHNAQVFVEIYDLFKQAELDAVVIASPTPFHFFQARAALEAGLHVFIKPPVARHLEEGDELLRLAKEKGRVTAVGHSLRAFSEYAMMRQRVQDGAVGKPGMIRLGRRTPHPRGWYSNFESSGGVTLDAMIHEFDFLRWTFGPVKRIFCQSLKGRYATEQLDYSLVSARLESGAIAHVESSWCHYGQFALDAEIAGDKGLIRYDNQDAIPLRISLTDWNSGGRRYFSESPVLRPAHFKPLEQFVRAIQGEPADGVSLEDGVEALRIAHAALRSIETKRPVAPAELTA